MPQELPGAPYLYTLAMLGMTFIGFSVIVMLLRQTLGRKLRTFDALFAHVYMEFGLIITAGAVAPLALSFWPLDEAWVWRLSAGLIALALLLFGLTYAARRRAASGQRTPLYVRLNVGIVLVLGLGMLSTAAGALHGQAGAMYLSVLSVFLIFAVGAWLQALNLVLAPK